MGLQGKRKQLQITASGWSIFQLDLHVLAELGIEGGEGFVQQEDFGATNQGPGEGHPLALPSGKLIGFAAFQTLQRNQFEGLEHAPFTFRGLDFLHRQTEFNILSNVQMGEQRIALEDLIHVSAVRGKIGDIRSVDEDLSLRRGVQTGNHAKGGGFPTSGGTEKSEKLTRLNFKTDVI